MSPIGAGAAGVLPGEGAGAGCPGAVRIGRRTRGVHCVRCAQTPAKVYEVGSTWPTVNALPATKADGGLRTGGMPSARAGVARQRENIERIERTRATHRVHARGVPDRRGGAWADSRSAACDHARGQSASRRVCGRHPAVRRVAGPNANARSRLAIQLRLERAASKKLNSRSCCCASGLARAELPARQRSRRNSG